jgi:hypothetical protein
MPADVVGRRGTEVCPQRLDPRPVRRGSGVLPSSAPEHEKAPTPGPIRKLIGQAALADTGFATDQNQVAATAGGLVNQVRQLAELAIATDEASPDLLQGAHNFHSIGARGSGEYEQNVPVRIVASR